jgi:hypothetical protein
MRTQTKYTRMEPDSSGLCRDLTLLIEPWVVARLPQDTRLVRDPASVVVPDSVRRTITSREPWSGRAIEDARLFLALPAFFGVMMEVLLEENITVEEIDGRPQISPLRFRVEWATDMSGAATDHYDGEFATVAFEDGAWRLIKLFQDDAREELRTVLSLVMKTHATTARESERQDPLDQGLLRRAIAWLRSQVR